MRTLQTVGLMLLLSGPVSISSVAQPSANQTGGASWNSPENEVEVGKTLAALLENNWVLPHYAPTEYVGKVGQHLARACNLPFPVTIKIIDAEQIDAISLPGGFLYVTSGLVEAAGDEAELAAALAHELAHVCLHHFVRGMTQQEYDQLMAQRMQLLRDMRMSVKFPVPPLTQTFPPDLEAEADDSAVQLLRRAGYDPRALPSFFARIEALETEKPGSTAVTFSSHLHVPGRNRKAEAEANPLGRRDQLIVNTSEFDAAKTRLLAWMPQGPRLFSIFLTTLNPALKAGSPVELDMTLTNTSNRIISFYSDGLFPYEIEVRDSAGRMVPDTEAGFALKEKRRNGVIAAAPNYYFVKPRESVVSRCVLNDYYDMSKPGTYFVQVQHRGSTDSWARVVSNTLAVAIPKPCATPEVSYDTVYSVDVPTRTPAGRIKPQSLHACSGDLDKKLCSPLLVHRIDPQYTDETRQAALTGKLVIGFFVNGRGNTEDAQVLESLGKGLDEQAVAAVKQWRFRPAVYKGEPFPVHATVTIEFGCRKPQ